MGIAVLKSESKKIVLDVEKYNIFKDDSGSHLAAHCCYIKNNIDPFNGSSPTVYLRTFNFNNQNYDDGIYNSIVKNEVLDFKFISDWKFSNIKYKIINKNISIISIDSYYNSCMCKFLFVFDIVMPKEQKYLNSFKKLLIDNFI